MQHTPTVFVLTAFETETLPTPPCCPPCAHQNPLNTHTGLAADAPDAPLAGWNSSSESYSFAYLSESDDAAAAAAPVVKLLLKVLAMGDTSLVACLATDAAGAQPQTLELNLDEYVTPTNSSSSGGTSGSAGDSSSGQPAPLAANSYKKLDQLCQLVHSALADLTSASVGSSSGGSSRQKKQCTSAAAAGAAAGQQQQQQGGAAGRSNPGQQDPRPEPRQQPDPDYDPLRIGPPRRPMRVGECSRLAAAAFCGPHKSGRQVPLRALCIAATWWWHRLTLSGCVNSRSRRGQVQHSAFLPGSSEDF